MPTSVIRYVNAASTQGGNGTTSSTGSGDANRAYINLTQAVTTESAATPNLVTSDILLTFYCQGTGADAYQLPQVFPFTTDSTRYVIFETPLADRGSTPWQWSTSRFRLSSANARLHTTVGAKLVLRGLQIEGTRNFTDAELFFLFPYISGTNITIEECILRQTGASSGTIFTIDNAGESSTVTFRNNICVVQSSVSTGNALAFQQTTTAAVAYVYNNTIISDKGVGIVRGNSHQVTASNNLVQTSGSAFSGTMLLSYNASSDATSTGTGARTNQTFTFVDSASRNYALSTSDAGAKGYGTDLSSLFTTDIRQVTRVIPWDIGAYQVTTTATAVSNFIASFVKSATSVVSLSKTGGTINIKGS